MHGGFGGGFGGGLPGNSESFGVSEAPDGIGSDSAGYESDGDSCDTSSSNGDSSGSSSSGDSGGFNYSVESSESGSSDEYAGDIETNNLDFSYSDSTYQADSDEIENPSDNNSNSEDGSLNFIESTYHTDAEEIQTTDNNDSNSENVSLNITESTYHEDSEEIKPLDNNDSNSDAQIEGPSATREELIQQLDSLVDQGDLTKYERNHASDYISREGDEMIRVESGHKSDPTVGPHLHLEKIAEENDGHKNISDPTKNLWTTAKNGEEHIPFKKDD